MEAMQISAPTFSQQIVVTGVEDISCPHTFFLQQLYRMCYRRWQPYQMYDNLEFWHSWISYSCLCGTHAEYGIYRDTRPMSQKISFTRIVNTNRERVTLVFVLLHLASHRLNDTSLLSNDQVSSLEYPLSRWFAVEEDSCLPLASALIFCKFIIFMADTNSENLMSKRFHRWASWAKSEQSSTKPVSYCAWQPQTDPSGRPVWRFRNNSLGNHFNWMHDSYAEVNTSIVLFYFTSA